MLTIEFILLFFLLLINLFVFSYSFIFFLGAPFVATPKSIITQLLSLSDVTSKDILFDLGSGDGRILINAASICKMAVGYEINPFLVIWTKMITLRYGKERKVKVYWKNYKNADLRSANVVIIYGIRSHMSGIEKILKKDVNKGTRIVSYKFQLTGFKLIKRTKSGLFLYIK